MPSADVLNRCCYFYKVVNCKAKDSFSNFLIDRPPENTSYGRVRSIHPPGRRRSSFDDVASVNARTVASIELTENHDVGRGQRHDRGKL